MVEVTDREMAASAGIHMPPMRFHMQVVNSRRQSKLGVTRGWPIDDTGAIMAAAWVEAVIKKMPLRWGFVVGHGLFKTLIESDEEMNSLFKIIAENREVLKRPFKETAKKTARRRAQGRRGGRQRGECLTPAKSLQC